MRRAVVLVASLLTLALTGCVADEPAPPVPTQNLLGARAQPLWHAPQDFPHPAYGYATLTNPAEGTDVPTWWRPIPAAALPDHIAGMEHLAQAEGFTYGAGMALFGSLAVVPGMFGPLHIVDISNPANPVVLAQHELVARGTAVIAYPNGTLVAVLSTDANVNVVLDITDPTTPTEIARFEPTTGSHKIGVVPGTPIVYNANSNGGGAAPGSWDPATATGVTEIYDLSNPWDPVHVQDFENGYGCHHIYFHIEPAEDYHRALCAGIEMTQIWDIRDPLAPEVLVDIPVHHADPDLPPLSAAPAAFSHAAIFNDDHSILIVGDETGGGVAPGCDLGVDAGTGPTLSGPLGNLWFYDVSDEQNPELISWYSPTSPAVTDPPMTAPPVPGGVGDVFSLLFWSGANCTAHHGRLIPSEDRDLLAWAFYGAGVIILDFTDPANIRVVDQFQDATNTWEVWYYNGYLFTGDLARGFDALRIV